MTTNLRVIVIWHWLTGISVIISLANSQCIVNVPFIPSYARKYQCNYRQRQHNETIYPFFYYNVSISLNTHDAWYWTRSTFVDMIRKDWLNIILNIYYKFFLMYNTHVVEIWKIIMKFSPRYWIKVYSPTKTNIFEKKYITVFVNQNYGRIIYLMRYEFGWSNDQIMWIPGVF